MNHPSSGLLLLSKAIPGFIHFKTAEGLSDRTIASHEYILQKWLTYQGDKDVAAITSQEIITYLSWLRTDYTPKRFNGKTHSLSPKTLRNIWVGLSSFYTWASKELHIANPMKDVPSPKFQKPPIEPFTQDEVQAMLKACTYSREARPGNRKSFVMRLPHAKRDQAIIMVLVDTGLRAGELCKLRIGDIDSKTGRVEVKHGVIGGAKGGKGRTVFLGKAARRAVWRYLADREDDLTADDPIFISQEDRAFTPDTLRQVIKAVADRAGVKNAYPHKFRHTFAIAYLRAGGDVFTLQALLGHASLDMVRHYARIAEVDVQQAHRKASPADNWRL
jgi:integrase/recombinase XerD